MALFTTPYGSYPGCRHTEDLERARATVGRGPGAGPGPLSSTTGIHQASIERTRQALRSLPEVEPGARLVFTAHNLPLPWPGPHPTWANCVWPVPVAEALGRPDELVSRAAAVLRPAWLEPDCWFLQGCPGPGGLLSPVGSFRPRRGADLDVEAAELCGAKSFFRRAATVGVHSSFVGASPTAGESSPRLTR